jgi:hypothetical protein
MFHLLITQPPQGNFFHHARNNEISAEKNGIPAALACMAGNISRFFAIHTEYHARHRLRNFFVSHLVKYRPFSSVRCSMIRRKASSPRRPLTLAMVTMYERPSSFSTLQLPLRGNRFSTRVTMPFKRPRLFHL